MLKEEQGTIKGVKREKSIWLASFFGGGRKKNKLEPWSNIIK